MTTKLAAAAGGGARLADGTAAGTGDAPAEKGKQTPTDLHSGVGPRASPQRVRQDFCRYRCHRHRYHAVVVTSAPDGAAVASGAGATRFLLKTRHSS